MDNFNVYEDIQMRTGGGVYIGVAGPVRTDKSIFTKWLMELLVFPAMEGEDLRSLSRDGPPQSAAGKTIMTMEPKFIPREVARVSLVDSIKVKVRVIDCVEFMADGAAGHVENDKECLAKIPWFDHGVPLTQTTEIGTREVIGDCSTIGVVMTTDGTIGEIKRPGYVVAERQTTDELRKLREPPVVLLGSTKPYSDEIAKLAKEMSESYEISVFPVSCEQLEKEDIFHILERVLKEFPVTETDLHTPKQLEILPLTYWLEARVIQAARNVIQRVTHMKDMSGELRRQHTDTIRFMNVKNMQTTDGRMDVQVDMDGSYYYQILNDYVGLSIEDECQLMQALSSLANIQKEYGKVQNTLTQMRLKGYGVVTPERSEAVLGGPQVIEHSDKYSVKIKAGVPSINLIKIHIETEIAPTVGNEQQAQDLVAYIEEDARESDGGIWDTSIFGKSIEQIMGDGIQTKMSQMAEDCQLKLQNTLRKIINDSNSGVICTIT